MTTSIRISNYRFFGALAVAFVGFSTLIIGIISRSPLPTILGTAFTILGLYLYRRYKSYELVLSENLLIENWGNHHNEISFKDIEELDCELIKGWRNVSIYPIFRLILKDGSKTHLKVHEEASMLEIADWIKIHFPSCKFSKNVVEVLSWKKYTSLNSFFFGSKR